MKNYTKKQIAQLVKEGKIENLKKHLIFFNKKQLIDALFMIMNTRGGSYDIQFESIPYSKSGKYKKHTSILHTTQSWVVAEHGVSGFYVSTSSSSKSAACPDVIVPKFGTDEAKKMLDDKITKESKLKAEKTEKIRLENKAKSAKIKAEKAKAKADEMKSLAKEFGFKSVAELKRANNEIIAFNKNLFEKARQQQLKNYVEIYGSEPKLWKIEDRVRLSRIDLKFEEDRKTLYFF